MLPLERRWAFLVMSSPALALVLGLPTHVQAQSTAPQHLGTIQLFWDWVAGFGNGSPGGSGTTLLGKGSVEARADGSGDANSALLALPNVQYRNDTDDDAGENIDDVLDLRPQELSISGARVDENNFMIDGVGINSLGASDSPYTSTQLSRETGSPNVYAIYGTHSQTQFVPTSMLEGIEVTDSNVGAEHGGFQGGIVNYRLKQADSEKASGSLSLSYQDERFTHYKLGTEDGLNPLARNKPEWSKRQLAFQHNQPLNDRTAIIFGFSRSDADGLKQLDAQYNEGMAPSESRSDFYRFGLTHNTGIGTFGLRFTASDYDQEWRSAYSRDMEIKQKSNGKSLTASFDRDLGDLSIFGQTARDVKFSLEGTLQANSTENDYNSNVAYNWIGRGRTGWDSTLLSDWCHGITAIGANTVCRSGGYGDRALDDTRTEITAKLSGDIWAGSFSAGAKVTQAHAERDYEGYTLYTSNSSTAARTTTTLEGKSFEAYICAEGDEACTAEQYAYTRSQMQAQTTSVTASKLESWLELSQQWGDLSLRSGLRLDYNTVLKNWDLAPRLVGSWDASDVLTLSMGVNRYYSDNWIGYKIHDNLIVPVSSTRTHDATTGAVGEWSTPAAARVYRYTDAGLNTPFTDEVTLGATYNDPWDGEWRVRATHRKGTDQFARSNDSTNSTNVLTNDGWTKYDSVSLEYRKQWDAPAGRRLDRVGLTISAAWADRSISNNSYFNSTESGDGTAGLEEYYLYNGNSYMLSEFNVVNGNMDIPVKAGVEMRGSWDDGRYELGVGADVAFGYRGVIDTDTTAVATHAGSGYTGTHYVWEDHDFDATVSMNLSAKWRVLEQRAKTLDLNLRVSNLLDDTGNATASTANPWRSGRSAWLGATYTW